MKWRDTPHGRLATEAGELSSKGNHEGALVLLEKALALKPENPLVLVYHGRVLSALGREDEAERSLLAALRIDGELSHAWDELGMIMEDREKVEKAAFCYEQSARISPCAPIFTMLASMQLAFDPEKSLENAERALSMDPEWSEAKTVRNAAIEEIRRLHEE